MKRKKKVRNMKPPCLLHKYFGPAPCPECDKRMRANQNAPVEAKMCPECGTARSCRACKSDDGKAL